MLSGRHTNRLKPYMMRSMSSPGAVKVSATASSMITIGPPSRTARRIRTEHIDGPRHVVQAFESEKRHRTARTPTGRRRRRCGSARVRRPRPAGVATSGSIDGRRRRTRRPAIRMCECERDRGPPAPLPTSATRAPGLRAGSGCRPHGRAHRGGDRTTAGSCRPGPRGRPGRAAPSSHPPRSGRPAGGRGASVRGGEHPREGGEVAQASLVREYFGRARSQGVPPLVRSGIRSRLHREDADTA